MAADFAHSLIVGTLLAMSFVSMALWYKSKRHNLPRPPGPKRLPVAGSAFYLPKEREWLVYKRWSREHDSDILYYDAWGNPFIIINSQQVAVDLLERRSALYADRPRMPMLNDLCGWSWDLGLMPYNDDWKLGRKMFTQHFRQASALAYREEEKRCSRELVRDILHDDKNLYEHVRLMYGKLIMSVTYGIDVNSTEDSYITNARKALFAITAAGNVGTYLVDSIPLLKYIPAWVPGAQFQRDAKEWSTCAEAMAHRPYRTVREAMTAGTARPSVLHALFEEYGDHPTKQQEYAMLSAAGTAYEAASETTWSATLTFILAMVMYPDIQSRAYEELRRAVGTDRFPEFSDQARTPYLTAICKEALRWRTPLPLAVMHRVTKDDNYKGYHIPGGSTVVLNSWAILHDERVYEDPDQFRPERFLNPDGQLDPSAPEPVAVFGFGRRACPGSAMAQDTLWIAAASLLWAFEMDKAKDEMGRVIDVEAKYTFGVVSYPELFQCTLRPRSDDVAVLIHAV